MLSDETLAMQGAKLADADAFAELMRRHRKRVWLLLTRYARDPALAEDLTQETFVRAWRKIGSYTGGGRFVSWLSSIAYREFLMHARKRKEEALPEGHEPIIDDELSAAPELSRLLALVSEEEAILLTLSYAWELSHREIGEVTGQSTGTVKSKIHRAKGKIRDRLALTGAA